MRASKIIMDWNNENRCRPGSQGAAMPFAFDSIDLHDARAHLLSGGKEKADRDTLLLRCEYELLGKDRYKSTGLTQAVEGD